MLAYAVFASCACACRHWPSTITSANAPSAFILTVFCFIDPSLELRCTYKLVRMLIRWVAPTPAQFAADTEVTGGATLLALCEKGAAASHFDYQTMDIFEGLPLWTQGACPPQLAWNSRALPLRIAICNNLASSSLAHR